MYAFMSAEPRPYRRPPRSVSVNGSLVQASPATGTTSEWPDSITPGRSSGPMVANRLALPGSLPCCTNASMPWSASRLATQSMSAWLLRELVVSNATRRARMSTVVASNSGSLGSSGAACMTGV